MENIEPKKVGRPPNVHTENPIQSDPVSDVDMNSLLEKISSLEKAREEDQEKFKMLEAVSDKGRMFNYRNQKATKKPMTVNLATYEGRILIGWRIIKDILVKNPTTGLTVGEEQEIELVFLSKDDKVSTEKIQGYPRFSEIRYSDRIEATIIGRTEDNEGKVTYDIGLPDGREIKLDEKFVN